MMYYVLLLVGFFVVLMAICLIIYVAVIRGFYWGDKKGPTSGRGSKQE